MSSIRLRLTATCAGLLFFGAAGAADPVDYCTNRELRAKDTTTIQLQAGVRDQPAFYLREDMPERVLFFRPEDVLALFDSWSVNQQQEVRATLERIRSDLPLKEDTDLFKYALRDAHFGAIVEYLAADLLEMGKAAVDFSPLHMPGKEAVQPNDQFDPSSIKRVYWKTRGGDGHKYCDPRGFGILTIVETIND